MVAQDLVLNAIPSYWRPGEVARQRVSHELLDQLAVGGFGCCFIRLLCVVCFVAILVIFVFGVGTSLSLSGPLLLFFVVDDLAGLADARDGSRRARARGSSHGAIFWMRAAFCVTDVTVASWNEYVI